MTQQRSRALGRAIMGATLLQVVLYATGAARRSYLAMAVPVGLAVAAVSALAFWVGYTMATTDWDAPADYPLAEDGTAPGVRQ